MAPPPEPALTATYLNYIILSAMPMICCQTLILAESLRVIPGEVRILTRIYKRKRINIAEILFFLIKYTALLAFICEATTDLTSGLLSAKGCLAMTWIYEVALFLTTTWVSCALAWRCYVIFQRRHRVGLYLLAGLSTQLTMAMLTASSQLKYTEVDDGYCTASDEDSEKINSQAWYQRRGVWFLLYSCLFDGSLVALASWRLIRCVRGPSGLQRISKLLFLNNMHFLCIVSLTNLIEFIIYIFHTHDIPSLLPLAITLEVLLALQLLISEQDAAHGYGKTWVSGGTGISGGGGGRGGTTKHTTLPTTSSSTTMARPSVTGTSSQWSAEHKRSANMTASSTSTNPSGGEFASAQQQQRRNFNGLEGIRYDSTDEILIDYDMTLAALSPKDDHQATEYGIGSDKGGYESNSIGGLGIPLPACQTLKGSPGNYTTPLPRVGTTSVSGRSIREIRAKVHTSDGSTTDGTEAGYMQSMRTHTNHGPDSYTLHAPPMNLKREREEHQRRKVPSISSMSTLSGTITPYQPQAGTTHDVVHMNVNVIQHSEHSHPNSPSCALEEIIPIDPDAPFADYQRSMNQVNNPYTNGSHDGKNGNTRRQF